MSRGCCGQSSADPNSMKSAKVGASVDVNPSSGHMRFRSGANRMLRRSFGWRSPALAAAFSMLFVAMNSTSASCETTFRAYHNPRFGVAADIPSNWRPEQEAENGDGRHFTSPDGGSQVAVFGANVGDDLTESRRLRGSPLPGEDVTYRAASADRITLSGFRDGKIFYRVALLGCRRSTWAVFDLEYPVQSRTIFDAVVRRMARSLRIVPHANNSCGDQRHLQ